MKSIILLFLFLSNWCYSQHTFVEWIDTLSSSHFSGRGPANNGDSLAANYIGHTFIEHGLVVEKQSFIDDVVIIDETPKLNFVNQPELIFGENFMVNPSSKPGVYKAKTIYISDEKKCAAQGKCWKNKALIISTTKLNTLLANESYKEKFAEAKMVIELVKGVPIANMAQDNISVPHVRLRIRAFTPSKKVTLTINSYVKKRTFYNVIGRLEGKTDKTIVLCAHYDHLGTMGGVLFPGANDNASGVSTLFTIAQHYDRLDEKPNANIVFIAFGAEEIGLLGSTYFVENPTLPLDSLDFVFNLDLLGAGSKGLMIQNASEQKNAFELLKEINNENEYFTELKSRANAPNSDHWPFSEKGVDAIFMYSLGDVGGYHNKFDTADHLEEGYSDEIKKLILDFISEY